MLPHHTRQPHASGEQVSGSRSSARGTPVRTNIRGICSSSSAYRAPDAHTNIDGIVIVGCSRVPHLPHQPRARGPRHSIKAPGAAPPRRPCIGVNYGSDTACPLLFADYRNTTREFTRPGGSSRIRAVRNQSPDGEVLLNPIPARDSSTACRATPGPRAPSSQPQGPGSLPHTRRESRHERRHTPLCMRAAAPQRHRFRRQF